MRVRVCLNIWYPFSEWCAAEDCFGPSNRWPVRYKNTLPGVTTCQTLQSQDAGPGSCMWLRHLNIINTHKKDYAYVIYKKKHSLLSYCFGCWSDQVRNLNIKHFSLRDWEEVLSFKRPNTHVINHKSVDEFLSKYLLVAAVKSNLSSDWQVLAMSSRSWLSYSYQSRFHLTPLSYETLEYASGFASEQCPEGIVAISTNTLRYGYALHQLNMFASNLVSLVLSFWMPEVSVVGQTDQLSAETLIYLQRFAVPPVKNELWLSLPPSSSFLLSLSVWQNLGFGEVRSRLQPGGLSSAVHSQEICDPPREQQPNFDWNWPQCLHGGNQSSAEATDGWGINVMMVQ